MAVDILSARWLIPKRTSLTADNATTIIQEGRIYHRKRKLPLINACRLEQLQCGSKAIPTRGSISCESSGNLCGRHEFTLTQCLHEKSSRKEIDVPCRPCQIALKQFGLTKKKLQRTACDVQRIKLVECFSLEQKKAENNTTAESHKKNSVPCSQKRGVELEKEEDEEYSAPTKLTQSMRLQSELCWQRLSFKYHWPGNSLPVEHFIQAIYWEKVARFQFNSWVCSQPHAAGDGCTM